MNVHSSWVKLRKAEIVWDYRFVLADWLYLRSVVLWYTGILSTRPDPGTVTVRDWCEWAMCRDCPGSEPCVCLFISLCLLSEIQDPCSSGCEVLFGTFTQAVLTACSVKTKQLVGLLWSLKFSSNSCYAISSRRLDGLCSIKQYITSRYNIRGISHPPPPDYTL